MRILIRVFAIVLLLAAIAVGLFAADYTITVTVNGGAISYTHSKDNQGKAHGAKGHQKVQKGDQVTWVCDGTCQNLAVKFKKDNPCSGNSTTSCKVSDSSYVAIFPYSIAAVYGTNVAIDDPDIIVDNSGTR